jgi:uncharacterized protein (DUF2267 family)
MRRLPLTDLHLPAAADKALRPLTHRARRLARKGIERTDSRLRWLAGRGTGLAYRVSGRHPAKDVPDQVVAERVRAVLGVELKRMGVHGVHVDCIDRVVYLRGTVDLGDAQRLEPLVAAVPGVLGVQSYLELAPDVQAEPSRVLARLLSLAREQGCHPPTDRAAVLGVLSTFAGRIPAGELRHLWSHLPGDVRGILRPPVRLGQTPHRIRRLDEFYRAVAAASGLEPEDAERVTGVVLSHLHALVPEDAADVEAVLPGPLKTMWHLTGAD